MNICHIVPIYLPGILPGCSRYIQDISEILSKEGHQVTVLTADAITGRGWVDPVFGRYSSQREERINGVRIKRLNTRWPVTSTMHFLRQVARPFLPGPLRDTVSLLSAGPYIAHIERELGEESYDIIHVTAFPFALVWLVWKACKKLGAPFVCSPLIHFEDPSHKNPLLWKALGGASSVIACSNFEKQEMIRIGILPSKIHHVPMGINPEGWESADGERFRKRYDLEEKKILLFAGTKDYNKGAIHLLRAMRKIGGGGKEVVLVAIGLPTREWKREKERGGEINLLDLGYTSEEEKKDAFDACDIFVMPSRYDSFGIVYLEAWRCAKPVIGARVGAVPEVIEEEKDGLLVEFGEIDQLVSTLLGLLNHAELRRRMGEAGRQKVMERFSWQKNIKKIEDIYLHAGKRRP